MSSSLPRLRVLVVTKGHPFDAEPFFAVFDALGHDWDHVEHPEAQAALSVDGTAGYDAVVMYDMPGIEFTGGEPPAEFVEPSADFRRSYLAMLEAGRGLVFMHHAIASWPAWPEFAELIGARFFYQPGELGGRAWPDSGYRFDVTHVVDVVDPNHPVCAELGSSFELTDELYLFPVLEDRVVPLLRSRATFEAEHFYSADLAIRGRRESREGWSHPPGSDLVAWATSAGRSPIAYLQFGDGPVTYADPNYRRVLDNAIGWVASPPAHAWAAER